MKQFDVCQLRDPTDQLVVVLQDDLVDELETCVVAPLSSGSYRRLISHLRFGVEIAGEAYVVQLDRLAAIERRTLGAFVATLEREEHRIKRGLDLLFFGV